MNISAPFIKRPVGTSLLAAALLLSGGLAFNFLPVAPLPQVEFPVISVSAGLPGASPETMASAVATPLERQFGRIAGINQMTSTSQLGSTSIVLQFDLSRNIDGAARDVQAAINAARSQLPSYLPGNPTYRKVNPADAPIMILALTSETIPLPKIYDAADSIRAQKLAQVHCVGQVFAAGGAKPQLQASLSTAIALSVVLDRTTTVRASVHDIELTLIISVVLVILVVFAFLRTARATLIPSIAVPLSLIGTFGVMYLLGYSLDNLSLMALAISTGFVVDDAIVVLENITRFIEQGMTPVRAAFRGAREIGFTVLSMSVSLVAVFIPILLMGGLVGRLFREFAVVLSIAICVSLAISLTLTPMMCAKFLRLQKDKKHGRFYSASEWSFDLLLGGYKRGLDFVLRHQPLTFAVTIATACLSVYLYMLVPKGFFPQQDTGRISGSVQAAQDISFSAMKGKMTQFMNIVIKDPAVATSVGFAGGNTTYNTGRMFMTLKPLSERKLTADQVIGRLRSKLAVVPGATLYMQSAQDLTIGGRNTQAQFQYTLQGENLAEMNTWAPRLLQKLRSLPQLRDVNTDQQDKGLQASVLIDRDTAARLGVAAADIDAALYDAFGQRQVSIMYRALNQYHVVMEVAPEFANSPDALQSIYVRAKNGTVVPLASIARFGPSNTSLGVNHQGQYPSVTLSFNLAPGIALGDATNVIDNAERSIGLPSTNHGGASWRIAFGLGHRHGIGAAASARHHHRGRADCEPDVDAVHNSRGLYLH